MRSGNDSRALRFVGPAFSFISSTTGTLSDICVKDRLGLAIVVGYVTSLRSPEGLMVDIPGLIQYGEASMSHVVIPLLVGQVKGEDHTRQHLLHCVNETSSGIQVASQEGI